MTLLCKCPKWEDFVYNVVFVGVWESFCLRCDGCCVVGNLYLSGYDWNDYLSNPAEMEKTLCISKLSERFFDLDTSSTFGGRCFGRRG